MYLFNFQDQLQKFENCGEILDYYIPERARFYELRKSHELKQIERELADALNKMRFIEAIVAGELNIFMTRADLDKELEARQFARVEGTFTYLTGMPISSLQSENARRFKTMHTALEDKLQKTRALTVKEMWFKDLDELASGIDL